MSRTRSGAVVAFALYALAGCVNTGQAEVRIPLFVAGTDVSAGIVAKGEVPVSLSRADLAFGPVYLCPGLQAGALCDTARLEWLGSAVVDTTDPDRVQVGQLEGVTGQVESWMFDLGLSSQLTRLEPFVLDAARDLGGVSLVIEGEAEVAGGVLPFAAAIPIQQEAETELGVPVIRKSTVDVFSHEVTEVDTGLSVRFDPSAWVEGLEFNDFVEDATCRAGEPGIVCAGAVEQQCDADGSLRSSRDCSSLGQVCIAATGCAPGLVIEPDTRAFRTLRNAVVSGQRPEFEWLESR